MRVQKAVDGQFGGDGQENSWTIVRKLIHWKDDHLKSDSDGNSRTIVRKEDQTFTEELYTE